jgi:aspartyl-tRNA(Asn)/glutamyl-tRNA(Gln) amidotransferase subunit C
MLFMEIKDIEKLAKLSRIELTDAEKEKYLKDISAILVYVDQIKNAVAETGEERKVGDLRNVMREDEEIEGERDVKNIIAEFPRKDGDYLKVKKILEN